jgi:hypothetical protein
MPYRGASLTMLAVREGRRLYSTMPVKTSWKQVRISAERLDEFRMESDASVFWIIDGRSVIAACDTDATGQLIERRTKQVVARIKIPAGGIVRVALAGGKKSPARKKSKTRRSA